MKENEENNPIHPSHYAMEGGLEVIDVMRMNFGMEAVYDFCLLNATKYVLRCNKKHKTPIEDLRKARYYLDYIINNKEAEERKEGQDDNR